MHPGQLERHTHDYIRHGTTDRFAALDIKAGTVIGEVHRRHRSLEFRYFLATVEQATLPELELHLMLDSSSIHKTPAGTPLAGTPSARASAFHTGIGFLAQPRGVLVLPALRPPAQVWPVSLHARVGMCHPSLHRRAQRSREAFRVDQGGR